MCRALGQVERSRRDIHLPVANHDVAVAAKAFYALVLVNVIVVGVQEIAVANHEVDDRIAVAVRLIRLDNARNVVNRSPVVDCRKELPAIAVVVGSSRPG